MTLNLGTLREYARHRAGGGALSLPSQENRVINDAGRYLFTMHDWQWRLRPPVTLDFVADQAYVELPLDFGQMVALHRANQRCFSLVAPEELARLRSTSLTYGAGSDMYGVIAYAGQASATESAQRARLEVFPTPTAAETGAMTLWYKARWVKLLSDTDAANVPEFIEPFLVHLVGEYAAGFDKDDLEERLMRIRMGVMLQDAKNEDGMAMADYGPILGGGADMAGRVLADVVTAAPTAE